MNVLIQCHEGVEKRCENAYNNAAAVGQALQQAVKKYRSCDMPLAFVAPENAAVGITTTTFSFNLPPPLGASDHVCESLAQRFVDLICDHPEFKPCVSFGQDNELIYATVPATSTQGAIKAEDKAKQAIGGVQLTRLSFPPTCNVDAVQKIVTEAVATIYSSNTTCKQSNLPLEHKAKRVSTMIRTYMKILVLLVGVGIAMLYRKWTKL